MFSDQKSIKINQFIQTDQIISTNQKINIIQMINSLSQILILCCLLSIHFSQAPIPTCTNNCQKLYFYTCQICYQTCSTSNINDSTFTMQTCQQEYCGQQITYTYIDSDNLMQTDTYCNRTDKRFLIEPDCTQTCCGRPSYTSFNTTTFNMCTQIGIPPTTDVGQIKLIVGITLGVVFGTVILILIICACIHLKACQSLRQCIADQCISFANKFKTNDKPKNKQVIALNYENKQTQMNSIKPEIIWYSKSNNKSTSQIQKICQFCHKGGSNSQTGCGHLFHFVCIGFCMNRSLKCIVCSRQNINPIKVYCQKCRQRYTERIINHGSYLLPLDLNIGNRVICDICKVQTMNFSDIQLIKS